MLRGKVMRALTMKTEEVRETLRRILRNELDDCERAIRNEDMDRAQRELDDAITKLKRLMNNL
jgi:predicted translin family RNA/ssDNA-binding protein